MNKWTQSCRKGNICYFIRYAPQKMASGKYSPRLMVARDLPSELQEFYVPLKDAAEYVSEADAAQAALKAGLEWLRDND